MSDGRGIMRDVLAERTNRGFAIGRVDTHHLGSPSAGRAAAVAGTAQGVEIARDTPGAA
jgi:hypothetical protein